MLKLSDMQGMFQRYEELLECEDFKQYAKSLNVTESQLKNLMVFTMVLSFYVLDGK